MTSPDFEATWIPRIGKEAAEELRRGRKIVIFGIVAPLFAGAAGLLIGTGTLPDVIGITLAAVAAGYLVMFVRAQRHLAAAMSEWFGIKITGGGTPKMNPKRFDAWCQERGLHPAPKLGHDERMLWSRAGSVASSREWFSGRLRVAGTLCVTSERVMFVPAKLGSIVIALPRIQQGPVGDVVSVGMAELHSVSDIADVGHSVSFVFRGGGKLTVAVDRADEALGELRALLPVTQSI